jgi:hypothetical protein
MKVKVFHVSDVDQGIRVDAMIYGKVAPLAYYVHVATLDVEVPVADNVGEGTEEALLTHVLEDAFDRTNNICEPWVKNPNMEVFVGSARSTSVGDMIETPEGKYVVKGMGFKKYEDCLAEQAQGKAA